MMVVVAILLLVQLPLLKTQKGLSFLGESKN